jgi:hypothetical protein
MDIDAFRYTPRYAPIDVWMALTFMTRSATNQALERGDLRAIRMGNRKLIDVRHGLEWLGSLPDSPPAANSVGRWGAVSSSEHPGEQLDLVIAGEPER